MYIFKVIVCLFLGFNIAVAQLPNEVLIKGGGGFAMPLGELIKNYNFTGGLSISAQDVLWNRFGVGVGLGFIQFPAQKAYLETLTIRDKVSYHSHFIAHVPFHASITFYILKGRSKPYISSDFGGTAIITRNQYKTAPNNSWSKFYFGYAPSLGFMQFLKNDRLGFYVDFKLYLWTTNPVSYFIFPNVGVSLKFVPSEEIED